MRSPRVYLPLELNPGAVIDLPTEAVHHLVKVLRVRQEQVLRLFNGNGSEYHASIAAMSKSRLSVEIDKRIEPDCESPLKLTLLQGLSKGEKMEFTIQKAVELGAQSIIPVVMERSVVRLNPQRMEKKREHWARVANSATEQCGRCVLTDVQAPRNLAEVLADSGDFAGFALDPRSPSRLSQLPRPRPEQPIRLLIGPEGGLSDAELQAAAASGYQGVSLGPRILRTETAGLAVISALQVLWGDL